MKKLFTLLIISSLCASLHCMEENMGTSSMVPSSSSSTHAAAELSTIAEDNKQITIKTSDYEEFTVFKNIIMQSETIKNMLADLGDTGAAIELPNINAYDFKTMLPYLECIHTIKGKTEAKQWHEKEQLITDLQKHSIDDLTALTRNANYLDIPLLLECSIKALGTNLNTEENIYRLLHNPAYAKKISAGLPKELMPSLGFDIGWHGPHPRGLILGRLIGGALGQTDSIEENIQSSSTTPPSKPITIKPCDGKHITYSEPEDIIALKQSMVIKNIIYDLGDLSNQEIPLLKITTTGWKTIFPYLRRNVTIVNNFKESTQDAYRAHGVEVPQEWIDEENAGKRDTIIKILTEEQQTLTQKLLQENEPVLIELLNNANYLNVKPLITCCTDALAQKLSTPENIQHFIDNPEYAKTLSKCLPNELSNAIVKKMMPQENIQAKIPEMLQSLIPSEPLGKLEGESCRLNSEDKAFISFENDLNKRLLIVYHHYDHTLKLFDISDPKNPLYLMSESNDRYYNSRFGWKTDIHSFTSSDGKILYFSDNDPDKHYLEQFKKHLKTHIGGFCYAKLSSDNKLLAITADTVCLFDNSLYIETKDFIEKKLLAEQALFLIACSQQKLKEKTPAHLLKIFNELPENLQQIVRTQKLIKEPIISEKTMTALSLGALSTATAAAILAAKKTWGESFVAFGKEHETMLAAGLIGTVTIGGMTYFVNKYGVLTAASDWAKAHPKTAVGIAGLGLMGATAGGVLAANHYGYINTESAVNTAWDKTKDAINSAVLRYPKTIGASVLALGCGAYGAYKMLQPAAKTTPKKEHGKEEEEDVLSAPTTPSSSSSSSHYGKEEENISREELRKKRLEYFKKK